MYNKTDIEYFKNMVHLRLEGLKFPLGEHKSLDSAIKLPGQGNLKVKLWGPPIATEQMLKKVNIQESLLSNQVKSTFC